MKHIHFLSYDKDSMYSLILAKRLGVPIDAVVYVDIRFNEKISGEHPKKAAWIPYAREILRRDYGIEVKHLTSKYTFQEYFYRQKQRGDHIGDIYGFPFTVGAWCNSRLKLCVIQEYINSIDDDVTEYLGIAYDEPHRYADMLAKNTPHIKYRSLLFENFVFERECKDGCKEINLLSPKYDGGAFRGGCWFCVKQSLADIYELWRDYPDYFNILLEMEKDSRCTFNRHYSLPALQEKFSSGFVPKRREKNARQKTLR